MSRVFFKFSEKRDFISDLYKNTTELFNIISINSKKNIDDPFETNPYSIMALNQHFTYLKEKYLHKILKYYVDLEEFIGQYFKVNKISYKLKDLGAIFFATPNFKNRYKSDKFLGNMFDAYNNEESTENKLKILCLIFCYLYEEKIKKLILEKNDYMTYNELYDSIKEIDNSYVSKWKSFIQVIESKDDFQTIIKEYLVFTKEIRHEILEFSFTPPLSSGEEKLLYLFINIYDYILYMKRISISKFTIIIDEPDTLLHPNWQKKIVFLLVTFINTFFRDDVFNIILTTHSPFLLSDIPKQNIIFLDTDDNENCKVVDGLHEKKQTFGANIHTLLSDSFFMEDGLMGEFAREKIDRAFNLLNQAELSDEDIRDCEQIISIVGEPIIKKQMQKMLDSKRLAKIDKIGELEAKISHLQQQLDELNSQ
jgi:polyhydroxyalkanoate synthesis regulator phasin